MSACITSLPQAAERDILSLIERAQAAGRLRTILDAQLALVGLRVRRAECITAAILGSLDPPTAVRRGAEGAQEAKLDCVVLPQLDELANGGLLAQVSYNEITF